jgi:hypothetical protein
MGTALEPVFVYVHFRHFVGFRLMTLLVFLMQGSKRPRTGMTEPFGQAGMVKNVHMQDFGSVEVNDSAITGIANDQIGSRWDWDDDRGAGMDIQALLSEFGDFGDFFENDDLPFGEVISYTTASVTQCTICEYQYGRYSFVCMLVLVHADFDCLCDEKECIRFAYLSMGKHSVTWEYLTLDNYYYYFVFMNLEDISFI